MVSQIFSMVDKFPAQIGRFPILTMDSYKALNCSMSDIRNSTSRDALIECMIHTPLKLGFPSRNIGTEGGLASALWAS